MANRAMRSCLAAAISILIAACMLSMNMDTTEAAPLTQDSNMQNHNGGPSEPKQEKEEERLLLKEEKEKKRRLLEEERIREENKAFKQLANETMVLVNKIAQHEVQWLGSKPVDPVALCTLLTNVATLLMIVGWTYFLVRQSNFHQKPSVGH